MNDTDSDIYSNKNNLMHIRATEVAGDYETEFDQMFVDHKFGSHLVSEIPHPSVTIDGAPLNIYFSPADHIQSALWPLINDAQSSIYFLFSFR